MPAPSHSEPLHVAALMHLDDALADRIRTVDPRLRLHTVDHATFTWLRQRSSWHNDPAQDTPQAAAARRDFQAAVAHAEIWFSPAFRALRLPANGPLRWAQFWSAGVERVLPNGVPSGVAITTAAGLHSVTIAEWVLAYMLAHVKRLPRALEQQGAARWKGWRPDVLRGQTVGLVGLGAIGRETARLCAALGMHVLATKRSAHEGETAPHCDRLYPRHRLPDLLAAADYVVLAAPLTSQTQGLIGSAEFAAMRPTAVLINVARGELVQWPALFQALSDATIAACYTDVTVPEPLPADDPAWAQPNLFITPHVAGNLPDYVAGATAIFIANLRRYLDGRPLHNLVDVERGY